MVFADNIYFNDIGAARTVKSEIEYLQKTNKYFSDKYSLCDSERTNLNIQNSSLKEYNEGLKKDKQVLIEVSDEYKKKFIDTTNELEKVKSATPSRLTWFTVGLGTAVLVGIVSSFALK